MEAAASCSSKYPNATQNMNAYFGVGRDTLLISLGFSFAVCRGIHCIGIRVMFQHKISDLYGHCGFEGNVTVTRKWPSDAPGQTKSFACHKPEVCETLRKLYQDCTIVKHYSTFFP